jgi:hypothetical protein
VKEFVYNVRACLRCECDTLMAASGVERATASASECMCVCVCVCVFWRPGV